MNPRQFDSQRKRLARQLCWVSIIMLAGMTAFETLKQIIHPDISIWESHTVTIVFSSICGTTAAFFILRKQIKLNSQLNLKNLQNERLSRELKKTVVQLETALTKIRPLTGLLPICASCSKIRDDKGYWTQIESYMEETVDVDFSRSICPECAKAKYPEIFENNA